MNAKQKLAWYLKIKWILKVGWYNYGKFRLNSLDKNRISLRF